MCGTIRAYQYSRPDAFETYDDGQATTIDGPYVSGISLTHGSPRQHIWIITCGGSEDRPTLDEACPCDASYYYYRYTYHILWVKTICVNQDLTQDLPLVFIQVILSGMVKGVVAQVYTCCELNNPPYFKSN